MMKNVMRYLSVFLSIAVIVTSLPLMAFAMDTDVIDTNDIHTNEAPSDIVEIAKMRTATDKYFRLDDGSYYVAHYDTDIHYLDANGDWQDIDNSLSVSGSEISTSNAKIKLAKKTTGNGELFTIHDGNRKLSLSLNDANKKIEGIITNNETVFEDDATQLHKMTTLDQISASVRYNDILEHVDLEYVIRGSDIKENIIVKEKAGSYSYSFALSLNNLVADMNEKGEIIISDSSSSESVYVIPAPFMWDANNAYSEQVDMDLEHHGNGTYTLTITADAAWMNATEREYPITIDPPIYTSSASSVLDLDFHTTSISPNTTADSLYVSSEWRAYWKLTTLPTLPASAYITDAQFSLQGYGNSELNGYVAVYDVLTNWDNTLIYSDTISTTSPEGKPAENYTDYKKVYYFSEYVSGNIGARHSWNITPIVKKWYAGLNYGLMLAPATDTTFAGIAYFRSNEYSTASERPQLCIQYRDMKGLEDYWSYTSQSVGYAGTGNINNATGKLTFSIPTLSTADSLMPYVPTLVYLSELANADYIKPNAKTPYKFTNAPLGFKLSMGETIVEESYISANGTLVTYYIWADSDGTEHYFIPEIDATGQTVYRDEDGLQLTLEISSTSFVIEDVNQTQRIFTRMSETSGIAAGGVLNYIADRYGNKIHFTTDNYGRVTQISLIPNNGVETQSLILTYGSGGRIQMILDPVSQKAAVFYYSNEYNGTQLYTNQGSYLRKVAWSRQLGGTDITNWNTYLSGSTTFVGIVEDSTTTYEYNSDGYLISARDEVSDYEVRYTSISGMILGVSEYAGVVGSTSVGQQMLIVYEDNMAKIKAPGTDATLYTDDDIHTTIFFDKDGRVSNTYSLNAAETQIYGASTNEYANEVSRAKNSIKTATVTGGGSPANYLLNGNFEAYNNPLKNWTYTNNVSTGSGFSTLGNYRANFNPKSYSNDSLEQCVFLPAGKYTLSFDFHAYSAGNLQMNVLAVSLSDSAHSVIKQVPLNEYYASEGTGFFSMELEAQGMENGGERFCITIQVTAGALAANSTADIQVDNVMLEKTVGYSGYNIVQFGSFEDHAINSYGNTTETWQSYWAPNTNFVCVEGQAANGMGTAVGFAGALGEGRNIQQTIYEADYDPLKIGSTDKKFIVSGFAKGTHQVTNANSAFRLAVEVHYYMGTGESDLINTHYFDFASNITELQYVMGSFHEEVAGTLTKIVVRCEYFNHPGTVLFDNISVVECVDESVGHYEYDVNGNLIFERVGNYETYYRYDANNNLIRQINNRGDYYAYEYDPTGKYLSSTVYYEYDGTYYRLNADPESAITEKTPKTKTVYTYNIYGQPLTVSTFSAVLSGNNVVPANSAQYLETSNEYVTTPGSHIFGAQTKTTDSMGRSVEYFYDETTGYLMATIQDNDDGYYGTIYTYDVRGNVTSVLPAAVSATNNYEQVVGSSYVHYLRDGNDRVFAILTPSTNYEFQYDVYGNTTAISAGSQTLALYIYAPYNGNLQTVLYANGYMASYAYDELGNVKEVSATVNGANQTVYNYSYNADGQLTRYDDLVNQTGVMYTYDDRQRLIQAITFDTNGMINLLGMNLTYDENSNIKTEYYSLDYIMPSGTVNHHVNYSYVYDANDRLSKTNVSAYQNSGTTYNSSQFSGEIEYQYDDYERIEHKNSSFTAGYDTFTNNVEYKYRERTVSGKTYISAEVSQYISQVGDNAALTYTYTYDDAGNIVKISYSDGHESRYVYDALGQLIREDNTKLGQTHIYTYDNAGNRKQRQTYWITAAGVAPSDANYQYTHIYAYGNTSWGDQMTAYADQVGVYSITYDAIGNPTQIGSDILTWQGRQLMSYAKGSNTYAYSYNDEGIRTSKTINGVKHTYHLSGSQIVAEEWGSNIVFYLYDADGSPIGMQYRNLSSTNSEMEIYWFEKNMQGDIVAVYDTEGTLQITYVYDAWGNCTWNHHNNGASGHASLNPFRYRGYYFDSETGLYYLQSRYYNPSWGRFISADTTSVLTTDYMDHLQYNLYAYAFNNPVNLMDQAGMLPSWATKVIIGTAVIAAATILTVATAGTGTALACFAVGALKGALVGATVGAATGAASGAVTHRISTGSWEGAGQAAIEGAADGYMTGAISGFISGGVSSKYCFIAGTPVATQYGLVPIEDISPGDLVWATNSETGQTELKQVVQLFRNETEEWVHVSVNGEKITATPSHPFYSPVKGWTKAIELRAGDILVMLNGEYVVVEQVQHELLESPEITYNFEVEGFHTYYVGKEPVLVHNKCKNTIKTESRADAIKEGKEFLGEGFTKNRNGYYVSKDGYRSMRFDTTHHDGTSVHINLETWRNQLQPGIRNKLKSNIHIFFK